MKLISGKEIFDSFGALHTKMAEIDRQLEKAARRSRMPKWKVVIINLCERILTKIDR